MSCIIKNYLFLSGFGEVTDTFKTQNNIKTIINVAEECVNDIDINVKFYKFNIYDDFVDIHQYFDEIISIINEGFTHGGVLVHCHAGLSRSATIVIAFLIKEMRMSLHSAYNFVSNKRPIKPNPHFMKQLIQFEKEILSTNSYDEYIDDYTVGYIMDCLRVQYTMFNIVKDVYIKSERDVIKTVQLITQPIHISAHETIVVM